MAIYTPIEWPDSTLNLQMGCDGCELWIPKKGIKKCYAGNQTERYAGHSKGYPLAFDKPELFLYRLLAAMKWPDLTGTKRDGLTNDQGHMPKPWLNGLPRGIFLNDMGDTFTRGLPLEWLDTPHKDLNGHTALDLLLRMKAIIMLLTKRPDRMRRFFLNRRVPDNFILMTSVTSRATMNRISQLLQINAKWHGISFEPVWGDIDIRNFLQFDGRRARCLKCGSTAKPAGQCCSDPLIDCPRLDWVIPGGESGLDAESCHLEHLRSITGQCHEFSVPVFVKQLGSKPMENGKPLRLKDRKGGDWNEWPKDLRLRQMPPFTLSQLPSHDEQQGKAVPGATAPLLPQFPLTGEN